MKLHHELVPRRETRPFFAYTVLLAIAALSSLLLLTPWNFLRVASPISVSEWKDDVWPLRPPAPWDISTDFPFPRSIEYDVDQGTWLRLDVHPTSGDIVFDMLGDLYCLPASEAYTRGSQAVRARPILLGIPHDVDPHFSPTGDRLVFRSDAELGVDNIWIMSWSGCDSMDIRPSKQEGALADALLLKSADEELLAQGVKETSTRKANRLLREGRSQARRVTNETFRYVTDARFHPSGSKVIATKWYTGTRSLGAGEGWEYNVSSSESIPVGTGKRLIGRTLPPGWDADNYNEQQIGPEQVIWNGEDGLIYSKNVKDPNTFEYNKDTHDGIYAIFSYNITTKHTETLVDSFPGGASRPELSRDGKTLAFVRRFRDYEALVLKDLHTGTIRHIWHGLTYDASSISAPMGTYPSFAFTPSDDAIIIWSSGQIYLVPLTTNTLGERIESDPPYPIKFTAHIEKRLAETRKTQFDLVEIETADKMRVSAFKNLAVDEKGEKVVFEAGGATYVQHLGKPHQLPKKVPVLHEDAPYYSPSFIEEDVDLVLHARWSDTNFTSFEIVHMESGRIREVKGLPIGRYLNPILYHKKLRIAFIKTGGDLLTGNVVATAGVGLYLGEVVAEGENAALVKNLVHVPSEISTTDQLRMRFVDEGNMILVQQSQRAFVIDLEGPRDEEGKPPHHTLVSGRMSSEIAVARRETHAAFVDSMQLYVTRWENVKPGEKLWSKPGNATKGLVRLSVDGGHDIAWSGDGKRLFWFLGPYLHSVKVSELDQCSSAVEDDPVTFGISCVKDLLEYQEVIVEHTTDIARLKQEAGDADTLVIANATILTMETGDLEKDLIPNGVVIVRGGVIRSVGLMGSFSIPRGTTVIDAQGGYVIPGFIDAHAHWGGFSDPHPAKSWEMETFLAYGVTTLHNPSASSRDGFDERSRLERGHFVGPRIFQTGEVIYGAGYPELHQDIADMAEARSALVRIKAEGGKVATSYKNYNLPSRASRQRLLLAARNLSMLCVPEGGMNYDWDFTYIIDGMTTVEHSIPVPVLYDDFLKLFAWSGTGNTPTHVVNYGGAYGEQLVWATEDIPNDPKLRRFTRHDLLEGVTESHARPETSYALFNTSLSVAKMVSIGNGTFRAHIGAHGEPPLGVIYHAEMLFTAGGGYGKERTVNALSPYQTLQAATSWAAQTFGLFNSLGSVSEGKLADLVIYPEGIDLLGQGGLERSRELKYVIRGGRVWDADVMEEVWPVRRKRQTMPPFNAE